MSGEIESIGKYSYGEKTGLWKFFDQKTNEIALTRYYCNGIPRKICVDEDLSNDDESNDD
jgi:hypothetical protein